MRPLSFFDLSVKPWGLVTAAGLVACVATVLGFLGRMSWPQGLSIHPPVSASANASRCFLVAYSRTV